jgi:hypothetical protein
MGTSNSYWYEVNKGQIRKMNFLEAIAVYDTLLPDSDSCDLSAAHILDLSKVDGILKLLNMCGQLMIELSISRCIGRVVAVAAIIIRAVKQLELEMKKRAEVDSASIKNDSNCSCIFELAAACELNRFFTCYFQMQGNVEILMKFDKNDLLKHDRRLSSAMMAINNCQRDFGYDVMPWYIENLRLLLYNRMPHDSLLPSIMRSVDGTAR